jgi:hypothetical protein
VSILKGVKVLCFDAPSEVLILKVVREQSLKAFLEVLILKNLEAVLPEAYCKRIVCEPEIRTDGPQKRKAGACSRTLNVVNYNGNYIKRYKKVKRNLIVGQN